MDLLELQGLQERQCVASTVKNKQCADLYSKGQQDLAIRLLTTLYLDHERKEEFLGEIMQLLVCGKHKSTFSQSQMETLIKRYQHELEEYAVTHSPLKPMVRGSSGRNTAMTLKAKLRQPINRNQFLSGSLYIFTWLYESGYVKVGCTEGCPSDRIITWAGCYPGARHEYSVQLNFPQRAEELIHLQMAKKRYEMSCSVRSCKSTYHDEWFKCSVDEMKDVIKDWVTPMDKRELYCADKRTLTHRWDDIARTPGVGSGIEDDVTAKSLLFADNMANLTIDFGSTGLADRSNC